MRFKITTNIVGHSKILPLNYQYPLSAAIYKILALADEEYASFLHNKGYSKVGSLKTFKLFTFSDINAPFKIQGDRMILLTSQAELVVSFHLPEAAENFIKGLFELQQIKIADKKSGVFFIVKSVEAISNGIASNKIQEIILQPISPIICGSKNERSHYDYLSPEHKDFVPQLMYNWKEKYKTLNSTEQADIALADTTIEVIFYRNPPKSRLITIKADTPAETKIRGFSNFRLKVQGNQSALELLVNSGVGIYNSLGMGSVSLAAM